MPQLTVIDPEGLEHRVEPAPGKRLVLAIEEDAGVRIGHRCGGNAKCTTCRVEFVSGEPDTMTEAEHVRLTARELLGQVRLSCQIVCDHDMVVKPVMTVANQPAWEGDNGPKPEATVQPKAEWRPKAELTGTGGAPA